MIKWIHSRIGAKLLITFSVVLVLSMASLIYIATQMVAEFGEFSASRNEANIRDNANAFLARITHEQAMRYDSVFKKFAASSALIAKQAAFLLENMALYGKTPLKPDEKLAIYPQNGIFSNNSSEKTMVLYWGSSTMSLEINEQINTLSHLDPLLEVVKESNPETTACYAVTEPGIARYYPNKHGVEKLPPTTKFDVRNANWYVIAKPENNLEGKTVWSNIYLDSVGQGLLITASTPVYSKSGQYLGAAGVDVTLNTIVNDILEHIPSRHRMEDMFSFLVDNQGRLIAFPPEYLDVFEIKIDRDKLVDATVVLKHSLLDSSNVEIRKIGESMIEKKYQVSNFVLNGRPYIISSHFMPSTGWRLGTVVPKSVILASVQETRNALNATTEKMTNRFVLMTVLFLIISIIITAILSMKYFIRPLEKLSKGALRVKKGDLTTHVDIHTRDEIGSLAQSFNTMVDTLQEAKEREKEYTRKLELEVKGRTQEIMIKSEELEKTHERLELAMDAGEHGFWDWNLDTDDIYFSPRYYTMLGYEPGELPMKLETWVDLMHPDDQKTIVPEVENYVKNTQPYEVEFRLKTKDGDWKWISGIGKSYEKDVDGIPHRAVGVHVDLTSRKQAEAKLQDSEQLFRSLFDFSPQAIALTDMVSGRLIDVNNMLCEMTKYAKKDIIGHTATEIGFYSDQDRKKFTTALETSGKTYGLEMNFKIKDGSILNALMSGRVIQIAGKPFIVTIFVDVTEQKKLESQLRQAQKMEAIGSLAGGIAHDFNNVLYAIIGYTELSMDAVLEGSKARRNLNEVLKAADRATDMVQQILTFSRKSEKEKKPTSVQSVLKEAVKLIRTSLPSTIEIRQYIAADCGPVMADPTQIHEVIMNLGTNAYHAMREKGGILGITLRQEEIGSDDSKYDLDLHPGPYLKLIVEDTGHGIDDNVMERIFDPYFTTKGVGEGTGMGLSVVHGIVKDHGGDIRVYSEPGKGTAFHVYLPVIETGAVERKIIPAGPAPTGTERILLVDDEETIVYMTQQILESLGYHVTPRTSSVEALEAFRARPDDFDLIITDMTMPNMTGAELAHRLLEIRSDIPIILCTGFSELMEENKAKEIGIREYVMKPIVRDEIARTVRKVLGG
ncbi:MAG: PAS domain S-box protein [Thermodesulfobacteriota bacterium]|nr:PAS domain S-box protein [Thermodesulfobacteriota bacterium]